MKILFLCRSNSCLSQMAEGIATKLITGEHEFFSAGIYAKPVDPLAINVMADTGYDISPQQSNNVQDLTPVFYDIVVTLSEDVHSSKLDPKIIDGDAYQRLFGGIPVFLHWPLDDPSTAASDDKNRSAAFCAARDWIRFHIDSLKNHGYLEALGRERSRMQQVADLSDSGLLIHDEFRTFFLVNDAFLQISGLTRDQVLGSECHSVFKPSGMCGESCQFKDDQAAPCGVCDYPTEITRPDGSKRKLRMRTRPIEFEPGRMGVMAVVSDTTEVFGLRKKLKKQKDFHGMVGMSPAIQEVFRTIESVSKSIYPVLITGESGTGKELVAAAIHKESLRSNGSFVPVNCGALPENILESELFGHVRGAFTGAIREKKGRFELADGGTLFLDEVGELPLTVQVKLLRVLQEKKFERVGGEQVVSVDVRIVCATNRNLREMVRAGSFREDLFYRLCVVPISLPPLRERLLDIPWLIDYFLDHIRQESGKQIKELSPEAMALISAHRWPGNIRELINALQFAAVRCDAEVVDVEHLPPEIGSDPIQKPVVEPTVSPRPTADLLAGFIPGSRVTLSEEAVAEAIVAANGNKTLAARSLGVSRATLYRFLHNRPD